MRRVYMCGGLFVLATVLAYLYVQHNETDALVFAMLDVGQGDALYIEAPNRAQVVIDGGPNNALAGELAAVMPFGDYSIDALVVTNPDADHYHGFISLLEKYHIGAVFLPGTVSKTETWKRFTDALDARGIPAYLARRGGAIVLDPEKNIRLTFLFPDRDIAAWSTNDGSVVSMLTYGTSAVLLTGDGTVRTESFVLGDAKNLSQHNFHTVLKAGHHGSKTSTGVPLLDALRPELVLISAGAKNRYGHPSPEIVQRLDNAKIPYLLTAREGRIICASKGIAFACAGTP